MAFRCVATPRAATGTRISDRSVSRTSVVADRRRRLPSPSAADGWCRRSRCQQCGRCPCPTESSGRTPNLPGREGGARSPTRSRCSRTTASLLDAHVSTTPRRARRTTPPDHPGSGGRPGTHRPHTHRRTRSDRGKASGRIPPEPVRDAACCVLSTHPRFSPLSVDGGPQRTHGHSPIYTARQCFSRSATHVGDRILRRPAALGEKPNVPSARRTGNRVVRNRKPPESPRRCRARDRGPTAIPTARTGRRRAARPDAPAPSRASRAWRDTR